MYQKIKQLRQQLFFTIFDLCNLFKITPGYARVLLTRYTKKEIFIRLKNNFYVLEEKWETFSQKDLSKIANFLQVIKCPMDALRFVDYFDASGRIGVILCKRHTVVIRELEKRGQIHFCHF